MKSRNNTSIFWHKIFVLFLLQFLTLYISCSNPIKEPFNNLIGHWISKDGQTHFYFSKKRRLIVTDENREILFDVEYNIGVVEKKTGNKIRKKMRLHFSGEIFGEDECWLTFSKDKTRINSTALGILNFVDRKQGL